MWTVEPSNKILKECDFIRYNFSVPLQNGDRKNSSEIKLPNNRQPRESTPVMCVRQNGVHNGIKVAPLEALVTTNDGVEFRTERVSRWLSVVQVMLSTAYHLHLALIIGSNGR